MAPFYLLASLAGLVLASLLFDLLRAGRGRLRGAPFERRTFLSGAELKYLKAIDLAAGDEYRVLPKVAAAALLRPEQGLGRRQRRLAWQALVQGRVDMVVVAAADAYPLCVVRLRDSSQPRAERRSLAQIAAGCSNAGMPVIELPLDEAVEAETLKRLVRDAMAMADVRVSAHAQPPPEDEEALLADLAAAMREPDELAAPPRR